MSKGVDVRHAQIKAAWVRWAILWTTLMTAITAASIWVDFTAIMAALLALLVGVLLYQRFVNKRSWRVIVWGIHAKSE